MNSRAKKIIALVLSRPNRSILSFRHAIGHVDVHEKTRAAAFDGDGVAYPGFGVDLCAGEQLTVYAAAIGLSRKDPDLGVAAVLDIGQFAGDSPTTEGNTVGKVTQTCREII